MVAQPRMRRKRSLKHSTKVHWVWSICVYMRGSAGKRVGLLTGFKRLTCKGDRDRLRKDLFFTEQNGPQAMVLLPTIVPVEGRLELPQSYGEEARAWRSFGTQ